MADLMGWAKVMLARRAEAREEARREKELAREEALRREQFAIQREGLAEQRRAAQAQEQRWAAGQAFQEKEAAQARERDKLNMLLGGLVEPTEQTMNIPAPEGTPDYLKNLIPPTPFSAPGPSFDFGGGMKISPISPEEQFRRRAGIEREAKMADIKALREDASAAMKDFFETPYGAKLPQHQRQALAVQVQLGQPLPQETLYTIAHGASFAEDPQERANYNKVMERLEKYQAAGLIARTAYPSPAQLRINEVGALASDLFRHAKASLAQAGNANPNEQQIFQEGLRLAAFIEDPQQKALVIDALAKMQQGLSNERPSQTNPMWDLFGGTLQE